MGLIRWLTKNWANTTEPTHPDLAPLPVPHRSPEVAELVQRAVHLLPRWAVVKTTPVGLHLTRSTRLFRFTDDITVSFVQAGNDRTLIHAESRSRVGKGDLGQNRRNILELFRAIRATL